jgi:pilus assembly protein Flp/PilA
VASRSGHATQLTNGGFMKLPNLRRDDRGVTSVEYGLIAAAIAVVIVIVVFSIGSSVTALFSDFTTQLVALAHL